MVSPAISHRQDGSKTNLLGISRFHLCLATLCFYSNLHSLPFSCSHFSLWLIRSFFCAIVGSFRTLSSSDKFCWINPKGASWIHLSFLPSCPFLFSRVLSFCFFAFLVMFPILFLFHRTTQPMLSQVSALFLSSFDSLISVCFLFYQLLQACLSYPPGSY